MTAAVNQPAATLTAADGIELASGISVTPAPGWTVGNQGPGWVTLHNALSTAEMEIKVKPSNGTDPVNVLQGDISHLSNVSTTGLTNVRDLSAPTAIPLQSGNFQQQATVGYSADGTTVTGPAPVQGWFVELLNTSTHQSAFVVFAQNGDARVRADGDAQAMLDSMQRRFPLLAGSSTYRTSVLVSKAMGRLFGPLSPTNGFHGAGPVRRGFDIRRVGRPASKTLGPMVSTVICPPIGPGTLTR